MKATQTLQRWWWVTWLCSQDSVGENQQPVEKEGYTKHGGVWQELLGRIWQGSKNQHTVRYTHCCQQQRPG